MLLSVGHSSYRWYIIQDWVNCTALYAGSRSSVHRKSNCQYEGNIYIFSLWAIGQFQYESIEALAWGREYVENPIQGNQFHRRCFVLSVYIYFPALVVASIEPWEMGHSKWINQLPIETWEPSIFVLPMTILSKQSNVKAHWIYQIKLQLKRTKPSLW